MKKLFLFWLILIFLRVTAFSQSCLPIGITFHTQNEIDSFQFNYPGCTEIEGFVNIGLYQEETDINNLNGLSVLNSIGGSLIISHNDNLTSLSGLNSIDSIGDQLGIFSNPALTNLEGLEGLIYVGALTIGDNANLIDFEGLENLATIGHGFDSSENPALTDFTGLIGLHSIGGNLSVSNNDALTSLDGLDNLAHIGSGLEIQFNNYLEDISALSNLVSVQNDDNWSFIRIKNNISLTSLNGLDNIDLDSIPQLSIGWNVALTDCDVYSICQYLADPVGEVSIQYNAPGCNSREEVQAACLEGVEEVVSRQSSVISYPNPFSRQTTFNIRLPEPSKVTLEIFNSLGQVVATILDQSLEKGGHQVNWSAEDLKPGIYFYRLQAGLRYFTGKIVVAR